MGSGLGLAIVKELSEALAGSVSVTSIPGRGTRFAVRLPAASVPRSEGQSPLPADA